MTIYGRKINNEDMNIITSYMDDVIREMLHNQITEGTTNEEFIEMYLENDKSGELLSILENEFEFKY